MSTASATSFSLLTKELSADSTTPESELLYGWQFTADQFVLATKPLEVHDQ
jgi:hypothetical protein